MVAIRKYRKQLGMTQAFLADKLVVSSSTVSLWETGERKPDIIMLKKLTDQLPFHGNMATIVLLHLAGTKPVPLTLP